MLISRLEILVHLQNESQLVCAVMGLQIHSGSFRKYVNPLHMWVELQVLRQQPVKLQHGMVQLNQSKDLKSRMNLGTPPKVIPELGSNVDLMAMKSKIFVFKGPSNTLVLSDYNSRWHPCQNHRLPDAFQHFISTSSFWKQGKEIKF